jgi:hypothetical protein
MKNHSGLFKKGGNLAQRDVSGRSMESPTGHNFVILLNIHGIESLALPRI